MQRYAWMLALAGSVLLGGAAIGYYAAGRLDGAPMWLAIAGSLLLLAYPALDRQGVAEAASSRAVRLGSGATLIVGLFAALAAGLYVLAERNDTTWDLTSDAQHTLADQSITVARGLSESIEVLSFFVATNPGGAEFRHTAQLLQEHTDKLSIEYVDPLRQPRVAAANEVSGDHGTVIVRKGESERRLEWPFTEERFVEALVMVSTDVTHKVCWAMGHGEPDPDDAYTERGLGAAVTELEGLNYQVMRQSIPGEGIARDCEVLVVVRPKQDWAPYEYEALAAYLAEGGRVVMLLEPGLAPGLAEELARYGVIVGDDLVIDVNPANQMMGIDDPAFVVISGRGVISHPITEGLGAALVFPLARTVAPNGEREGVRVRALLQTSEASWAETDPDGAEVGPDDHELQGDVPVATVVEIEDPSALEVAASTQDAPSGEPEPVDLEAPVEERPAVDDRVPAPIDLAADVGRAVPHDFAPKAGGKLVVYGDSDFASNVFLPLGNNRDLFLNSVAWLAEEESQLGERHEAGDTLEITSFGEAMLCITSVFLVPGGALLLAIASWLRRRRL